MLEVTLGRVHCSAAREQETCYCYYWFPEINLKVQLYSACSMALTTPAAPNRNCTGRCYSMRNVLLGLQKSS